MDRAEFNCAACEEQARRGRDLKGGNSGMPGSCEGPKIYRPFRKHPSGGFIWTGCPRAAVTERTEAFLAHFDHTGGRLSATEQRLAPWPLLDAHAEISFVEGLRRWQEMQDLKAQPQGRG